MQMYVWAYAFGKPAKYSSYRRMLLDFGLSLPRNWYVSSYASEEKTTDLSRAPIIQPQS